MKDADCLPVELMVTTVLVGCVMSDGITLEEGLM